MMKRYWITFSVEGLEASAETVEAARRFFRQHPEFGGIYESLKTEPRDGE
jgi:hypothetical protein